MTINNQKLNAVIDAWMEERQELIVLYCSLCGVSTLADNPDQETVLIRLKAFCETLVDYMSAGHFEIFEPIFEEAEDAHKLQKIQKTYTPIEQSTQIILNFNDTYDTKDHCIKALSILPAELFKLGELIMERFENEDSLIDLHKSFQETLSN
jgi:regulator of sigma D